jgi:hypothetical protein
MMVVTILSLATADMELVDVVAYFTVYAEVAALVVATTAQEAFVATAALAATTTTVSVLLTASRCCQCRPLSGPCSPLHLSRR